MENDHKSDNVQFMTKYRSQLETNVSRQTNSCLLTLVVIIIIIIIIIMYEHVPKSA